MMYNYIPNFSTQSVYVNKKTRTLAHYDMNNKDITFDLGSWHWCYGNKTSHSLYRKFIHTLSHEVIHAVTFKLLEQDRYNGQINPEWPTEHMDLYTGKNK